MAGQFTTQHSLGLLILIVLKAQGAALIGLPKMWAKRRQIGRTRKVSKTSMYRWLKQFRISGQELAFKE